MRIYSLLLLPDAASNYGGWTDPEFVRLLEGASAAHGDAGQSAAYRQVDAYVDEMAPRHPVVVSDQLVAGAAGPARARQPDHRHPGLREGLVGRLSRRVAAAALAMQLSLLPLGAALGFNGFGPTTADATFGERMTFTVELPGGPPARLELLMRFAGSEGTLVAPVEASGNRAEYVWDAADRYVVPNTTIAYRWRATEGGAVTLSREQTLLYDDDRPGLDWQQATIGEATVHWYGGAEDQARHLGELTADGAARAEVLLGHEMVAPVDIFVYDARDDFFGALGPGAREWFGAATFPQLRTIFMWLGAGSSDYLETTMVHEVTHVVFGDATDNPYHEPAKWLNEGLATWSETRSAAAQRATVAVRGQRGGLFAFDAIAYDFPFGARGSSLSYAMGTTMVGMIIDTYGEGAIARIAREYRDGASDEEALSRGDRGLRRPAVCRLLRLLWGRCATADRAGSHPALQCAQAWRGSHAVRCAGANRSRRRQRNDPRTLASWRLASRPSQSRSSR